MSAAAFPSPSRPQQPRARRPGLRVVEPPRRTGRFLVACLALLAVGVLTVVSLSALAAESAFAARELEQDIAELRARYDELTAEVAELESPDRIRAVAVSELGMVPASEPGYLLVERGVTDDHRTRAAGSDLPVPSPDSEGLLSDPLKPVLGAGG